MGTEDSKGNDKSHYHLPFLAADALLAISAVVVGILSLTLSSFPLALTPAASWAMIGGGAGLALPFLMGGLNIAKRETPLVNKYCCFENGKD